jgi:hypothetical protein
MNDGQEKDYVQQVIQLLTILGPSVFVALFTLITKPFSEKGKTDILRKSFLETVRIRMAVDVANSLPEKEQETTSDDYVEICKTKLNDYFSANSTLIVDFLNSENVYKSYVKSFKSFKYGIVCTPVLTLILGVLIFIFKRSLLTLKVCGISVCILFVLIIVLWVIKEIKRDKYSGLCDKYEVAE